MGRASSAGNDRNKASRFRQFSKLVQLIWHAMRRQDLCVMSNLEVIQNVNRW
jgi:hypothetical protein